MVLYLAREEKEKQKFESNKVKKKSKAIPVTVRGGL
jgi:hypothetical protein